ncbi:MAG: hypothetical protein LAT67_13190 [Balneolales bacterium]|nr:hypothetical protein [Balneolales bacterium]
MRLILTVISVFLCIHFFSAKESHAQALNIVAGNTFMGVATGAALGGATMALVNDANYRPLTMGIGLGTIGGVGIGIYDMITMSSGMRVHGLLNSSPTSGGIIFLDTLYGAGIGGLVGMAVALIGDSSIVSGIQYGSGAGAYAGFAFGLVDAFYFGAVGSQGDVFDFDGISQNGPADNYFGSTSMPGSLVAASRSIFNLETTGNSTLGFLEPVLINHNAVSPNGRVVSQFGGAALNLLSFKASF